MEEVSVSLDELTAKQRVKEFKSTVKEIKSKDVSKKIVALDKYNRDSRYLLEGGSLAPLIESLVPKKKTIDYIRPALETLLSFLQSESPDGTNRCLESCLHLSSTLSSLNVLGVLADVAVYKEEVKKPKKTKKKKKGDEDNEPPVSESESIWANRHLACHILSLIAKSIRINDSGSLPKMFADIPDILSRFSHSLEHFHHTFHSFPTVDPKQIESAGYVLDAFITALQFGTESISVFLSIDSIVPVLKDFLEYEELQIKSLQVFHFLSSQESCLHLVAEEDFVSNLLSKFAVSADRVLEASSKANDKKKGDNTDISSRISYELSKLFVMVNILTNMSQRAKSAISISHVESVIKTISPVVLDQRVWTESRDCAEDVQKGPVFRSFVRSCVELIGSFGLINEEIRVKAVEAGAIRVFLDIFASSQQVAVQEHLHELRHVVEKGLLHLATIALLPAATGNCDNFQGRWKSCSDFVTDCESLRSSTSHSGESLQDSNFAVLTGLLRNEDDDVANRACRLMYILLVNTANNDPVSLLCDLSLDNEAAVNLSQLLVQRMKDFSLEIEESSATKSFSDMQLHDKDTSDNERISGEEDDEARGIKLDSTGNDENSSRTICLAKMSFQEVICCAICCLEYLVAADSSYINVFSTEESVTLSSILLNKCGPVCNAQLECEEEVVEMFDPRRFDWSTKNSDHPGDVLVLRELICDVLALVAASDAKYRNYGDSSLPQKPCSPFPESKCSCEQAAKYVFCNASDPCLSMLLVSCEFKLFSDNVIACPSGRHISRQVTESALRLLGAIGSSGVSGLSELYKGLVRGLSASSQFSSLHYFQESLHAVADCEESDSFDWQLPSLFQFEANPSTLSVPSHVSEIGSRRDLWPFMVTAGALLGILSSSDTASSTASLALKAGSALSLVSTIAAEVQPAITDMFSASLLCLGGMVSLSGCIGRFGPMFGSEEGVEWVVYLIRRGITRQNFWDALLEEKIQEENARKEEEANLGAKDKKAAKKEDPKKRMSMDIQFPYEPDDSHPDPNHGPSAATWAELLNISAPDHHGSSDQSQPLIASIQGDLSDISEELIAAGADVNSLDGRKLSPLNHSLILGNEAVSTALLEAKADVNHLDGAGNPLVKYCFFAIRDDLSDAYDQCRQSQRKSNDATPLQLLGRSFFLSQLIVYEADLNVSDASKGNYPLHFLAGMGSLEYELGGAPITVSSDCHKNGFVSSDLLGNMIDAGASLNSVNHDGVAMIHVLAALGDLSSLQLLLQHDTAHCNMVDINGYFPHHYLAATCPENCVAVAQCLLGKGVRRPKYQPGYLDSRTGKSVTEKYIIDAELMLDDALNQALCPSCISLPSLSEGEIVMSKTKDGFTALLLALCGDKMSNAMQKRVLTCSPSSSVKARMEFVEYWNTRLGSADVGKLIAEGSEQVSVLQAFSLLLAGAPQLSEPEQTAVSALQERIIASSGSVTASSVLEVVGLPLPSTWTPIHCAILGSSMGLLEDLLDEKSVAEFLYIHFLAHQFDVSDEVCLAVINLAAKSASCEQLLNGLDDSNRTPLVIAVQCKNIKFIENLLLCDAVDVNVLDDASGRTALSEAVLGGDVALVRALVTSKSARKLDVRLTDNAGKSCIDHAFEIENKSILECLSYDFSDACVEKLVCVEEGEDSLLMRLEVENMSLCEKLGIYAPEDSITDDREDGDTENISSDQENVDTTNLAPVHDNDEENIVSSTPTKQPKTQAISLESEEAGLIRDALERSNCFLRLVLSMLQETNIVARDSHAHGCFFEGQLYEDYCKIRKVTENDSM